MATHAWFRTGEREAAEWPGGRDGGGRAHAGDFVQVVAASNSAVTRRMESVTRRSGGSGLARAAGPRRRRWWPSGQVAGRGMLVRA